MPGVDYAMVLAQEFLAGIMGDGTKLVIHVSDTALRIGDGDNGVFVECDLQVVYFLEGGLWPFGGFTVFNGFALKFGGAFADTGLQFVIRLPHCVRAGN